MYMIYLVFTLNKCRWWRKEMMDNTFVFSACNHGADLYIFSQNYFPWNPPNSSWLILTGYKYYREYYTFNFKLKNTIISIWKQVSRTKHFYKVRKLLKTVTKYYNIVLSFNNLRYSFFNVFLLRWTNILCVLLCDWVIIVYLYEIYTYSKKKTYWKIVWKSIFKFQCIF